MLLSVLVQPGHCILTYRLVLLPTYMEARSLAHLNEDSVLFLPGLIDPQPQLLELPHWAEGRGDSSRRVNALGCGTGPRFLFWSSRAWKFS